MKFDGLATKVSFAGMFTGTKKTISTGININKKTVLGIYTSQPLGGRVKVAREGVSMYPSADHLYRFAPGVTIYLDFKDGFLTPQIGPFKGRLGKTEAGYTLQNNIHPTEITSIVSQ